MGRVFLCDVDRPGLGDALIRRGMAVEMRAPEPLPRSARDALLVIALAGGPAGLAPVRTAWPGPLAVLSVDDDETVLAALLDAGADDAIPAATGDALIAARIAALRRRSLPRITVGPLSIDPVERRVLRDGRPIALLPREYRLLRYLAEQQGRPASRAELLRAVWGLNFDPGTNVVEVHVSRLRARIDRGFAQPMLRTEKGRGYFLAADTPGQLAIADPPAPR